MAVAGEYRAEVRSTQCTTPVRSTTQWTTVMRTTFNGRSTCGARKGQARLRRSAPEKAAEVCGSGGPGIGQTNCPGRMLRMNDDYFNLSKGRSRHLRGRALPPSCLPPSGLNWT